MKKTCTKNDNQPLSLLLDSSDITPKQIRLIKQIHTLLANLCTTDDESDYFTTCSDAMKYLAILIKESHFTRRYAPNESIPYADQAIEFSIDELSHKLLHNKIVSFDN